MPDKVEVLTVDARSPPLPPSVSQALGTSLGDAFVQDPVLRHYLRVPQLNPSSSLSSSSTPQSSDRDSLARVRARLQTMYQDYVRYAVQKMHDSQLPPPPPLPPSVSLSPFYSGETRTPRNPRGKIVIDYSSDYSSVAIWAFDGIWNDTSGKGGLLLNIARCFGLRTMRFLRTVMKVEAQHPHHTDSVDKYKTPSLLPSADGVIRAPRHAYLWIVGTSPSAQGKGVGSRVVGRMLKDLDKQEMPAYLETSSEWNIPFYERLGFKVVRRFDVDDLDCPPLWAMWRIPNPTVDSDGDDSAAGARDGKVEEEKQG